MPKASIRLPAKSIESGIASGHDQPGPQVAQQHQQDDDDQDAPLGEVAGHRARSSSRSGRSGRRYGVDDHALGQGLLDLLDLLP